MSYAIIAGVIFAWAVCFGWAALEVKDARKKKPVRRSLSDMYWNGGGSFKYHEEGERLNADFPHNAINVGGSGEQYQSGSLKADWYLDKNPVGTYYEEP